jgi:uncharacterized protein YaeQ
MCRGKNRPGPVRGAYVSPEGDARRIASRTLYFVIPAKAGIHFTSGLSGPMDPETRSG